MSRTAPVQTDSYCRNNPELPSVSMRIDSLPLNALIHASCDECGGQARFSVWEILATRAHGITSEELPDQLGRCCQQKLRVRVVRVQPEVW